MELTKEQKVKLYTNLVLVRKVDEYLVRHVLAGTLGGPFYHSQEGQEAIGVGVCTFLREDDSIWYTHRGHGVCECLAKGISLNAFIAENYGKATGSCQGIGFINSCDPKHGIYGLGGTVGGEATLAAGVALAAKLKGTGQVVCYFFGDGALGEGAVHAAMLTAANWRLPLIFVCSNNGMGMFVPVEASFPKQNIADWAYGYNIPATIADGQDVEVTYSTSQAAVERARRGEGPSFIEYKTCRYRPQCEGLPDFSLDGVRSEELVESWKQRDPVKLYREKLETEGLLSAADLERIDREVEAEIAAAEKFAKDSPEPTLPLLEEALYAG